jgi:hypothetical protein
MAPTIVARLETMAAAAKEEGHPGLTARFLAASSAAGGFETAGIAIIGTRAMAQGAVIPLGQMPLSREGRELWHLGLQQATGWRRAAARGGRHCARAATGPGRGRQLLGSHRCALKARKRYCPSSNKLTALQADAQAHLNELNARKPGVDLASPKIVLATYKTMHGAAAGGSGYDVITVIHPDVPRADKRIVLGAGASPPEYPILRDQQVMLEAFLADPTCDGDATWYRRGTAPTGWEHFVLAVTYHPYVTLSGQLMKWGKEGRTGRVKDLTGSSKHNAVLGIDKELRCSEVKPQHLVFDPNDRVLGTWYPRRTSSAAPAAVFGLMLEHLTWQQEQAAAKGIRDGLSQEFRDIRAAMPA